MENPQTPIDPAAVPESLLSTLRSKIGQKALIAIIAVLVGYGAGVLTKSSKKVQDKSTNQSATTTNTTNSSKSNSNTTNKKDKVYIRVETILPDGTRRITTEILDKGTVTVDASKIAGETSTTTAKTSQTTDNTVQVDSKKVNAVVYGIAGINATNPAAGAQYGLGVQKRILGPIWGGAFGTSAGNVGITLGVGF